jgi:hypothetical protein
VHDLAVSNGTLHTIGIFFLAFVAVEYGGITVLRIVRGTDPRTDFQTSFARAGHAHAAVLLVLATVAVLLADIADIDGALGFVARTGVWIAAILFPLGFFSSSAGRGRHEPNACIWFLYAGIVALSAGVVALGVGLLAP